MKDQTTCLGESVAAAPFDPSQWGSRPGETVLMALEAAREECGAEIFLDFEGVTFTYAEVDGMANALAGGLAALGIVKGQTVVTLFDNHCDAVATWFAINKLGAIWVPINTAYKGEFLRHQIADSHAQLAICDSAYLDNIRAVSGEVSDLRTVLVRGEYLEVCDGVETKPLDDYRIGENVPPKVGVKPSDLCCLIYTSGTTGPSKGCMVSHNYLCTSARQRNKAVPPGPGDVTWSCLPLFHTAGINGLVLATLLAKSRASVASRFSVSGFWNEIERSGATSILLLASMLPLLAQAPDNPAMLRCRGRVRVVTGVPLSAADRKIWEERFGVSYMNSFGYGLTEATMISYAPWGAVMPPLDSMGLPAEEFDIMIVDDNDKPVPFNTPGELIVRPRYRDVMFSGYWGRPEATVAAWHNLWMHTGDMARMDQSKYIYFSDRKKDYVRSRGENISSFEVETAIRRHPAVSEVAYHSIPVGHGLEDEIKATVILRDDVRVREEDLCRWLMDNVPHFAVPRFIEFREKLPMTPTGRVQKQELRNEGCTQRTWDARAAGIQVRRR